MSTQGVGADGHSPRIGAGDAHSAQMRRLLHTAMTRARQRLVLAYAARSSRGALQPPSPFVEEARAALGAIDILVTNAGGPPAGNFASTPLEAYQAALDLNLLSVIAMCKAAVPAMQEHGWGRVVAITSIAVKQPIAHLILSNTARSGATGFLKTLALEVAPDGITVNSVLPGLHATDRLRQLYGDNIESTERSLPTRAFGDPSDFGRVAAFLCSEHARFVTGVALQVDGGAYLGLL